MQNNVIFLISVSKIFESYIWEKLVWQLKKPGPICIKNRARVKTYHMKVRHILAHNQNIFGTNILVQDVVSMQEGKGPSDLDKNLSH